jgi:hypothetical protein
MNKHFSFLILISLLFLDCSKNSTVSGWDIGEGFEIYITKTPLSNDYSVDYSKLNLDTIALQDIPILRYDDLKSYEKSGHKLTLNISSDKLKVDNTGVYGRMFVVTIDKTAIYCGFKWPLTSSATCSYVSILDPYAEIDGLKSNEILIQYNNPNLADPRLDSRILDRLRKDGKLIE